MGQKQNIDDYSTMDDSSLAKIRALTEKLHKAKETEQKSSIGNMPDTCVKNMNKVIQKYRVKNKELEDENIELLLKVGNEKQKEEEILDLKEKINLACKENSKVVRENTKFKEVLKLRHEEIDLLKNSTQDLFN